MRLELTGKGIDITAGIRQLVDKRLSRIERLLGRAMVSAQCVLSKQKYLNRVDLTVHAAGDHVFHGAGEGRNWPAAMTTASDKVMQQSKTLKDKWKDKRRAEPKDAPTRRRGAKSTPPAGLEAAVSDRAPRIRKMRYPVKPMTGDEAAAALQDSDAGFLIFRNARTESVAIMVRRPDGTFGLIETEQ
ncbi:MAG: ribosome-associated translation inhibitor RaiA [Acidobacteria bacterium]|nr:ribosome-associated translation inhibitor RaiA [Acidobacteriota bacterium]